MVRGHEKGVAAKKRARVRWGGAAAAARLLVSVGLVGLLAVSPYFSGLAFPPTQLAAAMVVLALFLLHWLTREGRGGGLLQHRADWIAASLVGAYVISTLVAANPRMAVQEDLKHVLYFAAYWLARDLAAAGRLGAWLLGGVAVSGTALALFGVAAASGVVSYQDAMVNGRIASALQYPNALASYVAAAFLCAVGLHVRSEAREPAGGAGRRPAWEGKAWSAASYVLLLVFVFTYSRGGWLVAPLAALLFLLFLPGPMRRQAAVSLAVPTAAVAVVAGPFSIGMKAPYPLMVWGAFMGGLVLAVAGDFTARRLGGFRQGLGRKGITFITAAGVIGVAGAAVFFVLAPEALRERVLVSNLYDYNAWSRVQFTRDAMGILADHPWLGAGGGAWDALYLKYQSYAYWTAQVHNHYVQVLLETGPIGLLAFVGFWVVVMGHAWRSCGKLVAGDAVLVAGAVGAVSFLLLHAIIEFQLSLGSVSLLLWVMGGVVVGYAGMQPAAEFRRAAGPVMSATGRWTPVVAAALAFLVGGGLLAGLTSGERAMAAYQDGDFDEAEHLLRRAARFDPFSGSFRADAAQVNLARLDVGLDADLNQAATDARAAVAREPFNPWFRQLQAEILTRQGRRDEGLRILRQAVALHPFGVERYEQLALAELDAAESLLARGRREEARSHLQAVLNLADSLRRRALGVPKQVPEGLRTPLTTERLTMATERAAALLE